MKFQFSIIIIVSMICVITTQSTSKYEGVSWNAKRNLWQAELDINGKIRKFYFDNEFDAAKELNQQCDKMRIPPQNLEICESSNQEKKDKTSQFKGVYWHKETGKWYVVMRPKRQKQKYGGMFKDELDAAKRVNQLCQELRIPLQNPAISAMPNEQYQKKEKPSQYKGVYFHKQSGKWRVQLSLIEGKSKFGGYFKDELDAAKRVNQLCNELGIPPYAPEINAIPNQQNQKKAKTSKFKGVSWINGKWYVRIYLKGQKPKFGGYFKDELDAAKRANQLCEEFGIPLYNSGISTVPDQKLQKKQRTSQYKGIYWHGERRKWSVQLRLKGGKTKCGGNFEDEMDAAKKVNELCEKLGIPLQNPEISGIQSQQYQKKEKTSQYKGVSWHKRTRKWFVRIYPKEQKQKYGGYFQDELDAAKRVNQLCEELEIPLLNPEISAVPNQKYQKNCQTLLDHDPIKAELKDLVKILDKNNDPTTHVIKENLIASINNGEQTTLSKINLRTKNGESALSIAAKYGFSNVVKFLISKGAEKEHFTNDHLTPLSLAVSQNHLKVVQVLFEDWISPNSHEKPYLHLSPIFHVKSREIAQLLIENDTVTHEIYNDKNQSPLTVSCQNGYLDVVEFFLDDGLDINHLDSDNKTPLFYALANKHQNVAKLLISKGAQK